jgi:hypothetical protein
MDCTTGEFPKEPTIDGAGAEITGGGSLRAFVCLVDEPAEFGCGEEWVHRETGSLADEDFEIALAEFVAEIDCAAALPDDAGADGLAGVAIPEECGFALIGDSEGGDVRAPGGLDDFVDGGGD